MGLIVWQLITAALISHVFFKIFAASIASQTNEPQAIIATS